MNTFVLVGFSALHQQAHSHPNSDTWIRRSPGVTHGVKVHLPHQFLTPWHPFNQIMFALLDFVLLDFPLVHT